MASAEAPSASSLGPRYAPEDPTLPRPWKGLIDGSTGLLYYWNPETNITQYDKPVPMNPPLPPGPPPTASAPKIAVPVVGSLPSNVSAPEQQLKQNHPVAQQPQSVCQQMPALNSQQLPYHQTQPVNQQTQQPYPQLQSNQIQYPQVSYFQGPLMGQSPGQGSQVPYKQQGLSYVPYQQGSHFSFQQQPQQRGSDVPVQQQQQLQGSQVSFQQQHQQQHGPLASYQQQEQLEASKIPFHIGQQSQVSQTSHYQGKQPENQQIAAYRQGKQAQGQQIAANQQGQQIGFSRMEESLQQEGKQASLSLPQVQLTGLGPSNHQLPGPVTQIQVSQGRFNSLEPHQQLFGGQSPSAQPFSSLSSRGQQFSGLSLSGQQFNGPSSGARQLSGPSSSGQHFRGLSSGDEQFSGQHVSISSVQFPLVGTDPSYQGQQMNSPIVPNQVGQSMARPMGLPRGNEEDQRDRLGNDFLPLSRNEGTLMPSQLPKLALLPQRWNAQDMRKGGVIPQFVSPANFGELNLAPGHRMPDQYTHPPFPNSAPMRPTQRMFGVPEFPAITAADTYRQHHEVTTMHVEVVRPEDKQQRLDQILRSHERGTKIIIFCSTKRQCDQLAHGIGWTFGAASIHGDKSQDERDHALNQFRCGKAPILVATDVAARGLDIKGIRVVINYDFPTAIQDYVHRIGIIGVAGASGVSYTFFSHEDWKYAADLIKVLEGANQRVPPELHEMAARGGPPAFSRTLSHGGVSRWESGIGQWESDGDRGSGQWESDGCRSGGMGDFGGGCGSGQWKSDGGRGSGQWESDGCRSGGMGDFGGGRGSGQWEESDGGRSGDMSDFGGGRGGSGGRNDFHGGRGSMRGHGIGGPSGYSEPRDWRRHDRGPRDRYYNHPDGRGRFDGATRRGYGKRGRDRSYSRSPGKVRSRGYDSGRKGSWSRSRSRSLSWSWSRRRSRSWGRSRSRSRSSSRSRSRSRSYDRYNKPRRKSLFSDSPGLPQEAVGGEKAPRLEAPVVPGFDDVPPLSGDLSPMSPGQDNGPFPRDEIPNPVPGAEGSLAFAAPETGLEPGN